MSNGGEVMFSPDFEEATIYEVVPTGTYRVQVTDVQRAFPGDATEENPFDEDGNPVHPMMQFHLQIIDHPDYAGKDLFPMKQYMSGPHAGFLFQTLKALNPDFEQGDQISKEELVGRTAVAQVERLQGRSGRMLNNIRLEPDEE